MKIGTMPLVFPAREPLTAPKEEEAPLLLLSRLLRYLKHPQRDLQVSEDQDSMSDHKNVRLWTTV